jgi:hypothetical protein
MSFAFVAASLCVVSVLAVRLIHNFVRSPATRP